MHNQAKSVFYELIGSRTKAMWAQTVRRTLIAVTILLLAAASGFARPAATDQIRSSHLPMLAYNIPWD